jgi:hypothetical protein
MPILFVVKRSRPRLFAALRRLVARPGLVGVIVERREPPPRRGGPAAAAPTGRPVRQPLDHDGLRTLAEVGFAVMSVRALPEAAGSSRARPAAPAAPRPAGRPRARTRPARRRGAARRPR